MPFSNKKVTLFLVIAAIILIISITTILIFPFQNDTEKITKSIRSESLLFKNYLPLDQINKDLSMLNRESLPEKDRYLALKDIFLYFDNAYFNSGVPRIRNYVTTLDAYALKTFKNEYQKGDFYIACADYECGEKTPPEVKKLIEEIKNLPIDEVWKTSINLNLRTASHVPYDSEFNKMDKMISYAIAVSELVSLDNPQASASADRLRAYIKKTYNKDL